VSQHYYRTQYGSNGQSVTIICGWDYPLQQHYLVVELDDVGPNTHRDGLIYSNLFDKHAPTGGQCWEYFSEKLSQMNISVPEALEHDVIEDGKNQARNKVVDWSV